MDAVIASAKLATGVTNLSRESVEDALKQTGTNSPPGGGGVFGALQKAFKALKAILGELATLGTQRDELMAACVLSASAVVYPGVIIQFADQTIRCNDEVGPYMFRLDDEKQLVGSPPGQDMAESDSTDDAPSSGEEDTAAEEA